MTAVRRQDMHITPEQRRHFHDQGYIVLDTGLPMDLLDVVRAEIEQHYPDHTPGTAFTKANRVCNGWKTCPAVHDLATWPNMLDALAQIYGRRPLPFQTLNFPVGTEQSVHADTVHFNTVPAGWMCGVWVALEDIHPDSGPLVYYPGSHHLPENVLHSPARPEGRTPAHRAWHRLMVRLGRRADHQDYHRYEGDVAERLREFGLTADRGTLKKGQAMVWAANLLHGGSPRRDPARTRHSQVTHYYFEGCQYFTPVFSRGQRLHWSRPEFIPARAA